jgi:hypothetical protein
MADLKISQLTGATTPLAGNEVIPLVQGGVTKNVSVDNLTAGKATSADSSTLTTFQKIGVAVERSYAGTGTRTVTVTFGQTLNGGFWRNAIVEIVFHGVTAGLANEEYARYYIPVLGLSAWAIGTPVKVYGATLTITQTATTNNSVTFTVAGGSTSQIVSMYVLATSQGGTSLS